VATIESRPTPEGKPGIRVKIRLKGYPSQSATFARLTDARRWAQTTEAAIREGRHFKGAAARKHTVGQLIDRYIKEVLPTKPRNAHNQKAQLLWWKQQLGHLSLAMLTAAEIGRRRDQLLARQVRGGKRISPATVVRYLAALSVALTAAVKEWDWLDDSPMRKVRKPREARGRVRTLSKTEITDLLAACKASKNPHLYLIVVLAVSTGMRLGEIVTLTRGQVDLAKQRLVLYHTKNGDVRSVPLAGPSLTELTARLDTPGARSSLVFPGKRPDRPIDIRTAWDNTLKKGGITDFRFHDLRHCAASLLLESGASLGQLAEVLGHRTLQMVKRYTHLSESHSAKLVANMNADLFGPT
jgi:integrase